jgi:hypothetical protein
VRDLSGYCRRALIINLSCVLISIDSQVRRRGASHSEEVIEEVGRYCVYMEGVKGRLMV